MKKILALAFCLFASLHLLAGEEEEIKAVINKLFEGMAKGDSATVRSVFYPGASLSTIANWKGTAALHREDVENFIKAVRTPRKEAWNEKIRSFEIRQDKDMASVWAPYSFYVDAVFSHCGVNNFTLIRTAAGWKIVSIVDTRYKEGCTE